MEIRLNGTICLDEKQINHLCDTFKITKKELYEAIPRKGNIFTYIINTYPFEIKWEEINIKEIS